jgi:hypothetical protein
MKHKFSHNSIKISNNRLKNLKVSRKLLKTKFLDM